MLTIDIQLKLSSDPCKRRFMHESMMDSNNRRLIFDEAWVVYGTLRVGDKGELHYGSAVIQEGSPLDISEFATLSYIGEYEHEGETQPTCFNAMVYISSDTFNYLINISDEQTNIYLTLGFDLNGSIKYELYSDDGDRYWDISRYSNTECFFEVANKVIISTSKRKPQKSASEN